MNNRKLLILGVIIVTAFTVSLSENSQIVDGFLSQSTAGWVYELKPGESQVLTWTITNTEEIPIDIEFRGEGKGTELFVFEKLITFEAKEKKSVEFIVAVPDDHPDNIEYHVDLFALEKAKPVDGVSAAVLINYQMVAHPVIKIGDNPVFTPEPKPVVIEEEPVVKERPSAEDFSTPEIAEETIEEKLARIQAANQENIKVEPTATTIDEESTMDLEPVEEKECGAGSELVNGICKVIKTEPNGGGCLIATAAYGTELAPQVQFLREIRDNTVMSTASGTAFMTGFNQLYYSFSPTIADMERENPMFQEVVRAFITPMLSTLSIMTLVDEGSELQILGLGLTVISLNLGIYIAAPMAIALTVRKKLKI